MKDFSELVRLAEAATPGPWKQHLVDDTTVICSHGDVCCTFANGGRDDDVDFDTDTERCEANAAFIAAANPQTILALTARVKELEEALKPFAEHAEKYDPDEGDDSDTAWDSDFKVGDLRRARLVLSGKGA